MKPNVIFGRVAMYSYDDLFLFTKVVEIGSFINTAKMLKQSHSTIGRKIKNLEDQLNVVLIRRNTKNFEVTEIGKQIYAALQNRVDGIDDLIMNIVHAKNEPQGSLNVVLPPAISLELISPHIPEFLLQYPKINLNICYQTREVDLIKDGFDIALTSNIPRQQTQKIKNIFKTFPILYCTKKYAQKYGLPSTPQDLTKHILTGYILNDYSIPHHFALTHNKTGKIVLIPMPKRLTTNNVIQNSRFLQSNEAICAILSSTHIPDSLTGELIHVLPEYSLDEVNYYLLRHPHEDDLKIEVFCKFLEQALKGK